VPYKYFLKDKSKRKIALLCFEELIIISALRQSIEIHRLTYKSETEFKSTLTVNACLHKIR